ncbi:hypothetical protein P7K49_001712 [Saguinus oedipus]|uniref:Uncharacterized protein n=1 Tax=Saguinus oedipus TaxID=9490 RepID=A0ABQ9WFC9_SAGOE|nr:hypothetical protein P7K49_001712 [Saguinus oedipus]
MGALGRQGRSGSGSGNREFRGQLRLEKGPPGGSGSDRQEPGLLGFPARGSGRERWPQGSGSKDIGLAAKIGALWRPEYRARGLWAARIKDSALANLGKVGLGTGKRKAGEMELLAPALAGPGTRVRC